MRAIRQQCEQKIGVSEELIDGLNLGKFPRDEKLMVIISGSQSIQFTIDKFSFSSVQCYTHCLMESLNMIRKGKLKVDLAIKQIKIYMPPAMRDEWLRGIAACKEHGNFIHISQKILYYNRIFFFLLIIR